MTLHLLEKQLDEFINFFFFMQQPTTKKEVMFKNVYWCRQTGLCISVYKLAKLRLQFAWVDQVNSWIQLKLRNNQPKLNLIWLYIYINLKSSYSQLIIFNILEIIFLFHFLYSFLFLRKKSSLPRFFHKKNDI